MGIKTGLGVNLLFVVAERSEGVWSKATQGLCCSVFLTKLEGSTLQSKMSKNGSKGVDVISGA